jgi:glycosyltransferase involved in cell wall biosynthesis
MSYKIAYLTSKNPQDRKESSGVYYYQSKSLEKYGGELVHLGPVNPLSIRIIRKFINILNRFLPFKINHSHHRLISRIYGYIFSRKLRNREFDVIFADKSSCELAYLKTDIPIIYSTDATFNLLHNYYSSYSNLSVSSIRSGNQIEQQAIRKASKIICTSEWAKRSVNLDYHFPASRIHVLPRGANIDHEVDTHRITSKRKTDTLRLVFVGREWHRKGFDIAFQVMNHIRSKGIKVKLTAVGVVPPAEYIDDDVHVIPYIDKNTTEGRREFDDIMFNSDFYLMPSRAECVAIAFNEASAYGVPVITRDTGGVTEVIKNDINGYALPPDADFTAYTSKILEIYLSDKKYYNLVNSSRKYFETRLNWDVWGQKMKLLLDDLQKNNSRTKKEKRAPLVVSMNNPASV